MHTAQSRLCSFFLSAREIRKRRQRFDFPRPSLTGSAGRHALLAFPFHQLQLVDRKLRSRASVRVLPSSGDRPDATPPRFSVSRGRDVTDRRLSLSLPAGTAEKDDDRQAGGQVADLGGGAAGGRPFFLEDNESQQLASIPYVQYVFHLSAERSGGHELGLHSIES